MNEKTYVIKVNVLKEDDCYEDIINAIYDAGATDVDLLEVYED